MAEKVSSPPITTSPPPSGAPAGAESDKAGPSPGEKPQPDGSKSAATKGDPPNTGAPGPDSAKASPPHTDAKKPDASAAKPDPQQLGPRSDESKAGSSPPKSGSQQPAPTRSDSKQPQPAKSDAKQASPPKSEAANVRADAQTNVPPQPVSAKPSASGLVQPIPPTDAAKPAVGVPECPGAATVIAEPSPGSFQQMQQGPDFQSSNPAENGLIGDRFCFFVVMGIILAIPIIAIPLLLSSKGSDWNVTAPADGTSAVVIVRVNLSSPKTRKRLTTPHARVGIEQAGTCTTQTSRKHRKERGIVCHSTHCLALASLLQSRLNRMVDPCADFYSYVCGSGLGHTSPITSKNEFVEKHTTKPVLERANRAMRRASNWGRKLYVSCLKFSKSAEQELHVIRDFMASLKLDLGGVSEDLHEDPLDGMLQLSLLSLNNEDFKWFRLVSKTRHSQLQVYYHDVLRLHGMPPQSIASKDFRQGIIPLEKRVAGFITNDIKENASNVLDAVVMKVRELNRFTPGSVSSGRWARLVAKGSSRLFGADDAVLTSLSALRLVDLLVRAASPTDGRRLVAARLFAALIRGTYLESRLRGPLAHGAAPIEAKAKHHCLQKVSRVMSVPLRRPLSPIHVEAVSAAEAVGNRVRTAMAREAGLRRWLRGRELEHAVRKLFGVRFSVGIAEDTLTATGDHRQYRNQASRSGGSFVQTWLDAAMRTQLTRLTLNQSRGRDELNALHSRNAIYSGSTQRLVVPTALTEAPIFFVEGPASYNYGSLGQVIAHELFHVFNQLSSKVATDAGPLAARNDTAPHYFRRKMGCLLESYKKVAHNSEQPSTTRGYAFLADLVGLKTAHKAFDSLRHERGVTCLLPGLRLTPEQLFFVGHCALHCSLAADSDALRQRIDARERCHLPLAQMTEFGRSFNCKRGSPLRPFAECSF
ncbi:endothelin-converting enzyme 1-like isoform X3 [Dermacentor albipictus]|uniref:endothelin-converting enzyme 1-like isoform X3 n=1 Tax=Dermacentor albipictus TaxID=60249 RepID=UPI0031FCAE44